MIILTRTRFATCYSSSFSVSNGVKQGGILSPILYCIYQDEQIERLTAAGYGCYIGNRFVGVTSYADDIALLAPSIYALQKMLDICTNYGHVFKVT